MLPNFSCFTISVEFHLEERMILTDAPLFHDIFHMVSEWLLNTYWLHDAKWEQPNHLKQVLNSSLITRAPCEKGCSFLSTVFVRVMKMRFGLALYVYFNKEYSAILRQSDALRVKSFKHISNSLFYFKGSKSTWIVKSGLYYQWWKWRIWGWGGNSVHKALVMKTSASVFRSSELMYSCTQQYVSVNPRALSVIWDVEKNKSQKFTGQLV